MKNRKIGILAGVIASLLILSGCTKAENVMRGDETTPTSSGTAQDSTPKTEDEARETLEAKPETSLIPDGSETAESTENTTSEPELTSKDGETEILLPTEEKGEVPDSYREDGESGIKIIGRNGHYTGLMACWGTYENCDRYIAALNRAAQAMPEVNVYNAVIPTASDFYVPEDVENFTASQKNKISYIAEGLSGVTNADIYSAMEKNTDKYIYSRTDAHWQPLGAYYAAEAFAEAAGVKELFPSLSEYTAVTKEGWMGSLYDYSKSDNLYSDPEPFTMYISPNDEALKTTYYDTAFQNPYDSDLFVSRSGSAFYCSFLGSDDRIAEIETDCKNGRTLVIFKESYGNAMVPFLTECFEKIYVCDVRYFDIDAKEFCTQAGATDMLFAVCTFTPAGVNCGHVESLF